MSDHIKSLFEQLLEQTLTEIRAKKPEAFSDETIDMCKLSFATGMFAACGSISDRAPHEIKMADFCNDIFREYMAHAQFQTGWIKSRVPNEH